MRNRVANLLLFGILALNSCLPPSDKYPYKDPALVRKEAKAISDSLEAYVYKGQEGNLP